MKNLFLLWLRPIVFAGGFLISLFTASAQHPFLPNLYTYYIENPAVFELNQEEPRAYFLPATKLSLNGRWKFMYADVPEAIPQDFFADDLNDAAWPAIPVPSNWEMEGYGDKLFRNVTSPFKADPPRVPREYNPTGAYRTTFELPDDWGGKEIFLRLEKVASASFVWINGKEVGYNEGAQEPAEYRITDFVKEGTNRVAVLVIKYSDGYYLEGQDYWRLAGIFDDVTIYAAPKTRIYDQQIITTFDKSFTDARLSLNTVVKSYGSAVKGKFRLTARLFDRRNNLVAALTSNAFNATPGNCTVEMTKLIRNPEKWSAETPSLYRLSLQLLTAGGEAVDSSELRIGFKQTEIRNGVFYLNGVPIKISAQNSHMQHPDLGHVMREDIIRQDFAILKQFNFNAVRTSHYPPVNKYLDLADEYGLYIIDEAGTEAHATEYISRDSSFTAMYRERVRQMVLRDRNHPSVLFWSAGNESGEGFNITEVVKEGRRHDPTRYWMYGGNDFAHPAEEIIGPRYPTPVELEMQVGRSPDPLDIRPSFMDEYLSVAGNGGGGMDDYWRVIRAHPRLMGGAIWDFVSPGLRERARAVVDSSPYKTPVHLMGNAKLTQGPNGKALDLNGHDQWAEVYRSRNVELTGGKLAVAFNVFPRKLVSSCGSFVTKGSWQFGVQQRGRDSLEFYIYTNKSHSVKASLPPDWENRWHSVLAVYNGETMRLSIDGNLMAEGKASGNIRNFPFPVNIGRNAEIHGQETDVYICDAILDRVGIFGKDFDGTLSPEHALLWLDFEEETDEGEFFSYGIGARTYGSIWPDRRVQPEMWQMKKTTQPLSFRWIDIEAGEIEIANLNHFTSSDQYEITWNLEADGQIVQRGLIPAGIAPLSSEIVKLPITRPYLQPGAEYRITIRALLKQAGLWAPAGHEVAWEQLELPWRKPSETVAANNAPPVSLADEGGHITVAGKGFIYTFCKARGLLLSILLDGEEALLSSPTLNVWRAPLANEQDAWNSRTVYSPSRLPGYGQQVAAEFYAAGLDKLTRIPISVEAFERNGKAHIKVRNLTMTGDNEWSNRDLYIRGIRYNGFEEMYDYTISGDGNLRLSHTIIPAGQMPLWLPRIGLTMTLDKRFANVEWYGRGPQENYPDRKTGYPVGIYRSTVDSMYEPYLIPQDHGLRTDNRRLQLIDLTGRGLVFTSTDLFNFSISPFSTDNLTKATYTYQLRKQDGITLNIDYATSGTGCTARSIFPAYRVYPQEICRVLELKLIQK
ncbi:MAG: DUF4981 domain-containing protein [Tannerellaceae bacterium]|jgi:beta-galactosidase|nr:DUF4981 domain-containing protein [Tannerellaceae bacterium]